MFYIQRIECNGMSVSRWYLLYLSDNLLGIKRALSIYFQKEIYFFQLIYKVMHGVGCAKESLL